MIYKYLGFGKHGDPEVMPSVLAPFIVDTSFPEFDHVRGRKIDVEIC